ncbi:hypothetical protein OIU76_017847 [Salix suchowensis]|nr:hypothetical protein OIU76_017847 [Salix suchowensis]
MFRSARWRREKNKIKTVFKLQFHATQLPQLYASPLAISVVPGDVGKPTVRLEKGIHREESCRWDYPVYETVKYIRDAKTGKINERKYHFVVSAGSSKNSLVGEVSIDFADYAEATIPSTVSLPLKNSKSDGVLHISIQRLQEDVEQSEVVEAEDINIKSQSRTLNTQLNNSNRDEGTNSHSSEMVDENMMGIFVVLQDLPLINAPNNVSSLVPEIISMVDENMMGIFVALQDLPLIIAPHNAELNDNDRTSSGFITMSSSESGPGLNAPQELGLRNNMLKDPTSFLSSRTLTSASHLPKANASAASYVGHQQPQWELCADSAHGISNDDSKNSFQGTFARERSQQASAIEMEKIKSELIMMARQQDVSEMEITNSAETNCKREQKGAGPLKRNLGIKRGERYSQVRV